MPTPENSRILVRSQKAWGGGGVFGGVWAWGRGAGTDVSVEAWPASPCGAGCWAATDWAIRKQQARSNVKMRDEL